MTPPSGWMNDPCGLIHHAGQWHLFYQYNPTMAVWGNIHWGHAVSADLVTWTHLDPALKPDPQHGMIFTGSAVLDAENRSGLCDGEEGCLVAAYTHALGKTGKEMQSIAASNDGGKTWTPYRSNPVIPNPGLKDFRDPRVFWHGPSDRWIMVLAAGDHAPIYTSTDLKSWKKASTFGPIKGLSKDAVWECPELFTLPTPDGKGERWILKIDLNMGLGKGGSHGRYWLGSFDGEAFAVSGAAAGTRLDGGEDFYAAQTFSNTLGGRRVWIGWMGSWQYSPQAPGSTWRGAMSLPRELGLVMDGAQEVLTQRPAPEVLALRGARAPLLSAGPDTLAGESRLMAVVVGTTLELTLDLELGAAKEVGLRLFSDGAGSETVVGYDAAKAALFLDRRESGEVGFHPGFPARHAIPLKLKDTRLSLRVFVDRSTVEVFTTDGRAVISDTVYPKAGATRVSLYAAGGAAKLRRVEAFRMVRP